MSKSLSADVVLMLWLLAREQVAPCGEFPLTLMEMLTMLNVFTAISKRSHMGVSLRFPFKMKRLGMENDTSMS